MMVPTTEFDAAIYAAVAGLVVGSVTKLANKFFDKSKTELEMHVILRKELREELDTVKTELHQLQLQLDEWKEKYFHQVELTNELKLNVLNLTDELNEYKRISGIYPSQLTDNGWFDSNNRDVR